MNPSPRMPDATPVYDGSTLHCGSVSSSEQFTYGSPDFHGMSSRSVPRAMLRRVSSPTSPMPSSRSEYKRPQLPEVSPHGLGSCRPPSNPLGGTPNGSAPAPSRRVAQEAKARAEAPISLVPIALPNSASRVMDTVTSTSPSPRSTTSTSESEAGEPRPLAQAVASPAVTGSRSSHTAQAAAMAALSAPF